MPTAHGANTHGWLALSTRTVAANARRIRLTAAAWSLAVMSDTEFLVVG